MRPGTALVITSYQRGINSLESFFNVYQYKGSFFGGVIPGPNTSYYDTYFNKSASPCIPRIVDGLN